VTPPSTALNTPWELEPQVREFATWYAKATGKVGFGARWTKEKQRLMYLRFTGYAITGYELSQLKKNTEFKGYVREIQESMQTQIEAAQKVAARLLPLGMEVHEMALQEVKSKKDYKAAPALTVPLLDRVMPKKQETAPQAFSVTITTARLDALNAPSTEIEVEAVVVPDAPPQD
jgi:hypothetical protein